MNSSLATAFRVQVYPWFKERLRVKPFTQFLALWIGISLIGFSCQKDRAPEVEASFSEMRQEAEGVLSRYNKARRPYRHGLLLEGPVKLVTTQNGELNVLVKPDKDDTPPWIFTLQQDEENAWKQNEEINRGLVLYMKGNLWLYTGSSSQPASYLFTLDPQNETAGELTATFSPRVIDGYGLIRRSGQWFYDVAYAMDLKKHSSTVDAWKDALAGLTSREEGAGSGPSAVDECKCRPNEQDDSDCDHGGQGASGCGIPASPVGGGCQVDCQPTHYACCSTLY